MSKTTDAFLIFLFIIGLMPIYFYFGEMCFVWLVTFIGGASFQLFIDRQLFKLFAGERTIIIKIK